MQRPRPVIPTTLADGRFIRKEYISGNEGVYTDQIGNDITILFVTDYGERLTDEQKECIKMVYGLEHPHIVSFSEVLNLDTGFDSNKLCLVTSDLLNKQLYNCANEDQARWYFQQLIIVMDYCHRRDLQFDWRMEHLYVVQGQREANNNILKVLPYAFDTFNRAGGGTLINVATYFLPETLMGLIHDWKQGDVWKAGIILTIMLTGKHPWVRNGEQYPVDLTIMQRIVGGNITLPTNISEDCRDLLKKMIEIDPNRRITLEQIKNHPFFLDTLPAGALMMNDNIPAKEMPNIDQVLNNFGRRYRYETMPNNEVHLPIHVPAEPVIDTPTTPRNSVAPSHAPMSSV